MAELNTRENLFKLWMIYTSRTDVPALHNYIKLFVESHQELVDYDFNHLKDGFSEEGPHLTTLPDGVLQVLGNQLHQCYFGDDLTTLQTAADIIRCLIVVCRNYDNVPLVASCEFVSYTVTIATATINKILHEPPQDEEIESYIVFIRLALHFFECLYDPYFTWRKRLLGWNVDKTRLRFKPALLHVEVVPFFHDCFQKDGLPSDVRLRLIHVFGALMSGSQHNALKAITPATLDVLLKILASNDADRPTNEQRRDSLELKDLVLKCAIRMVHVIHCCSPDQRQVEVSQVMEGYMQVLLDQDVGLDTDVDGHIQLTMIGAINEMLSCQDRSALQVILVSGGTFDAFMSLLQKTTLCGVEAQSLAMSILKVMSTVLAGSGIAKERFKLRVGYGRFVEVLKSLGQPSMDLLIAVLNLVVEGQYEEHTPHTVHNTQAAIMLVQWLPDIQSNDLQIWLAENLRALCCSEHNNKMNCCSDGMISAVLAVLEREKQINAMAVSHLIGLLESLGTYSITAIELKQLIGLLRLNDEEKQFTYCSRLMRAIATMARREGKDGALHVFNIQEISDGISLPGIRKWPGAAFSFHTWLCLDCKVDPGLHNLQSQQAYRRQVYSFLSSSGRGFESFVTHEGDLVIAVYNKKEYTSVSVTEAGLLDSQWHCIDIVHTNSKRPFVTSQLNVYIDGKLKLNSQLKYPVMTEPLTSCKVGSPCTRIHPDFTETSPCVHEVRKPSPLKSILNRATRSGPAPPGIDSLPTGSQDEMWGPAITLHGQVGSVCIFHEAVSAAQVSCLYRAGPNSLTVFNDEADVTDLQAKLVLHYNAKACKKSHCVDLSASQNHGQLTGQKCVTWDIKDVINCIGGIHVLLPLLEQADRFPAPADLASPDVPYIQNLNSTQEQDDWLILPSSSYADTKLEQNQVAGFLTLLRNMVQTSPVNQDSFVRTNGAAVIGSLLQKVNQTLVDVHVLMAVQLLVEATAASHRTMLNHLYQYILFDFRIWSRSSFPVRIGHIQYLSTIIKDDRRHFRKTFGVLYMLDIIRSYYSVDCGLSEEDSKPIRVSLLNLVKYYIVKDITAEELSHLLNFMLACGDENMICEVLDLLVSMLEGGRKQDQLCLLMFEPGIGEMLYGLLTVKGYTIIFYEKIVKVLYILLKTDKVYEKSKSRLRLQDCGYLGLIGLMQGCEVSGPTIKRFLEQVSIPDTPQSYSAVLAGLQLIYTSGFDIKLEASRQLLSILVSKPGAAKHFAKQLGWQEAITKLFILKPIAMETSDLDPTICDNVMAMKDGCEGDNIEVLSCDVGNKNNSCDMGDDSVDVTVMRNSRGDNSIDVSEMGHSRGGNSVDTHVKGDNQHQQCVHRTDDAIDNGYSDICDNCTNCTTNASVNISNISHKHIEPPMNLDLGSYNITLGKSDSDPTITPRTPHTPMYLRSSIFDDLDNSNDDLSRLDRSASTSNEDLSAIGQRAAARKSLRNNASVNSLPTASYTSLTTPTTLQHSESADAMETRGDSPSVVQVDNGRRMLESLGLRGSFLMDSVEGSEELTQNLLIVLLTVMWKGVDGSDQTSWKERGQVFSWLYHLSKTNTLIRPMLELKRRLLEMMLHSCTTEIRDAGHTSQWYMENAVELMRLVRCFLVTDRANIGGIFSPTLIEDAMCLLDSLAVWDVQSGAGWQEMVHLGLSVILAFAEQRQLDLCAAATARLHMLVQTKLISSSAEAAYMIGRLNDIIIQAITDETENYSFLVPVLKALIDKTATLLNLDINLPNMPSTSMSPTFFDDFKTYCFSDEWKAFIANYISPQKAHFMETVFLDILTRTNDFWSACHEEMMVNMHKLNREGGESKIKFQSQIMEVYNKRVTTEERRYQNVTTQLRNQHLSALRQWRATKRFFTGERGAWADRHTIEHHWKLSNQENFSRMKVKLIQNYTFDIHKEASLLRDNLGPDNMEQTNQLEQLRVVKEALVAKENMADDVIGDEEWNVISTSSSMTDEYQGKEKLVLSEECDLITLVDVIKGRLEVTTTHVYFFDCSSMKEEGGEDFKWALSQLREIHFRRYNLRRSALELFLIDQTNYFLNFKKVRNKVYSRILSLRPPNLIYYGSRSPAELLKASGLVQKWVQREISNFEYLMQLNTIAGRTYNDLSQYPVFPWILCDYTSETLDLENPEVFRDLSKPIGVLNPRNEADVREKFDHFEDPTGVIEKFHYGTHYSNAASVMYYMVRMEPFTTLHIALQSERFDVADRQFHSIPGTWSSMYNNPNDVKELIPEFFYLPEFLSNMNNFDLGKLQNVKDREQNVRVHHVLLPKWATCPEDFIHKHRQALESEFVSNMLHHWIDLIFGCKQKGQAAIDALNVFYYCTYEGAVDLDAIKNETERNAVEGMINNFGQTPCQLLKDAHPQRMTFDEMVTRATKTDKHLSVISFLENLKVYFVEVSAETDPLAYICVPRSQTRSIIQHGMPDTMVSVSVDGIIGTHGWLPYDKSISNYFTFEKDPSVTNQKTKKKFSCPFAPGLTVSAKLFVVSHDAKLLFSGGHWDNSLQVYHIGKGRKLNHIVRHIDIVTCLSLDYCGSHLITGSRDTTCMVWQVMQHGGVTQNLASKPLQTLYGHDAEVTAVHISIELDMAISASKDGTVMLHSVRKGHYMRTLRPPCEPSYVMNIPMLAVDDMGHIIVYCRETFPIDPKEVVSLHLYSLNGKHIKTMRIQHALGHMIIKGDHLLTGDIHGNLTIYEVFGLHQLTSLPLHVPIHSLALTNGNSHMLAGLRDGKLIIIGIKSRSDIR